jgi:hypothetical protein
MISVDTGPAHVAAAVGCPLVVLFGSKHPSFYAPRSDASPVEVVGGSHAVERSMLDITPAAVMTAWERVLRATEGGRTGRAQSNPDSQCTIAVNAHWGTSPYAPFENVITYSNPPFNHCIVESSG